MNRNHPSTPATAALRALVLATFLFACSDATGPTTEPAASLLARGGKPGSGGGSGSGGGADVLQGDFALLASDAAALTSTCPGSAAPPGWAVVFGKSGCLIVSPLWASTLYESYVLEDDLVLNTQIEKGKNGRITHVRLNGQDVDGEAGIWHSTGWIAVAEPVVPSKAGFTLHVHVKNVEVWRYDSHLGGNPVEMIGTISIGDIVYRPQ